MTRPLIPILASVALLVPATALAAKASDGKYAGTDDEETPLTFRVDGGGKKLKAFKLRVVQNCLGADKAIRLSLPPAEIDAKGRVAQRFTIDKVAVTLKGTFRSGGRVEGTVDTRGKGCSAAVNWTAKKAKKKSSSKKRKS